MPIKACVFDAYGTLFDVAAAARIAAAEPEHAKLAAIWPQLAEIWRTSSFNTLGCVPLQGITRIFGKSPKMDWILPWTP